MGPPDLPAAVRASEDRRAFEELIERSSLGTPGAVALRKVGRGKPLTSEEQRAADAEVAEQARACRARRGR
jgi:hypothetical protein